MWSDDMHGGWHAQVFLRRAEVRYPCEALRSDCGHWQHDDLRPLQLLHASRLRAEQNEPFLQPGSLQHVRADKVQGGFEVPVWESSVRVQQE
jgi:hypothetical protein